MASFTLSSTARIFAWDTATASSFFKRKWGSSWFFRAKNLSKLFFKEKEIDAIPRQKKIIRVLRKKGKHYTKNQRLSVVYNTIRLMSRHSGDLSPVICPTLCFTGEYDAYISPEAVSKLARALPQWLTLLLFQTQIIWYYKNSQDQRLTRLLTFSCACFMQASLSRLARRASHHLKM